MRIILVGPGGMGTVHYMNYAQIPQASVAAVVGKTEADRQKADEWGLPIFDSVSQACEHIQAEMVDICAPTFLHKQLVLESIACGKHVLTEKPIALSRQDADEMYAAAEKACVQLYVGQVLQFTPEARVLHQAVGDGWYGKPLDACFERLSTRPAWSQGNWLLDKTKSGGLAFDLHIHDLDLLISLFGKPKTVRYTSCGNGDIPDQYRFSYGYDGLSVNAEGAWFNARIPFTARWRVYFERGMLILDGNGLKGYDEQGGVTTFDLTEKVRIPTGINLPPTGMFFSELSHFLERAEENRPSEKVPKEQVLAVLETLESVIR